MMLRLGIRKYYPLFYKSKCSCSSVQKIDEKSDLPVRETESSELSTHYRRPTLPLLEKPIVKTFFSGDMNSRAIPFPEFDTIDEVNRVNIMFEHTEKVMKQIDNEALNKTGIIPEQTLHVMGQMGLFGLQVPLEYGGMGLSYLQMSRVMEAYGHCPSLAQTLIAHQNLALQSIVLNGNVEQMERYLPSLAGGDAIAAFAMHEPGIGSNPEAMQCQAKISDDGRFFYLNGCKTWVTNGAIADTFIVFARTDKCAQNSEPEISAFIVDKLSNGLKLSEPKSSFDSLGANVCDVHFADCTVPVQNQLGVIGSGLKTAMHVLSSQRFAIGSVCAGMLRELINDLISFVNHANRYGRSLAEFNLVQKHISDLSMDLYAIESMTYYTAGLLDSYNSPDVGVESACVQIFATDTLTKALRVCMQTMGVDALMEDSVWSNRFRVVRSLQMFQGSDTMLKLYISQSSIQHFTITMLHKLHESTIFKRVGQMGTFAKDLLNSSFDYTDYAINKLQINRQIHINLLESGGVMGRQIMNLPTIIGKFTSDEGSQLKTNQESFYNLSNIAIDLFAIMCSISRATRSVSIGLQHADLELLLANSFTRKTKYRLDSNSKAICNFGQTRHSKRLMNETICVYKMYVPLNALQRKE